MILLTQETGFLKPFAWVLGKIFDLLFMLVDKMGIPNIGLCVILFTIIIKLILLPLTIKQQKFSKLSNMMNPELQAIQAKYKDKKDNESMLKMNAETKAVYEKYGTSPTGGCLTMIIQLPIMFALYRVIYKIPGYVSKIKDICSSIAGSISSVDGWQDILSNNNITNATGSTDKFIDAMYNFSASTWDKLSGLPEFSGVADSISANSDKLLHYNNFFGLSLTQAPGWRISWALIIPLLAGLTQWLSAKLMESKNRAVVKDNESNPMGQSMKVMNTIMPLMSAFFCITFPTCIGLYWITSSVVQIIQQLIINHKMDNVDVEQMVQENIDKVNAKRAKKGLPPKKITNSAVSYAEEVKKLEERDSRQKKREEDMKKSTNYYSSSGKPGSLASKANMVKQFNEKNGKKDE